MKNHIHYILVEILIVTLPWVLAMIVGLIFIKALF
jgi:hypothetical protein